MSVEITETWRDAYHQAVLEVRAQEMPERIVAARRTIADRLRDLEGDSDHHAERQQIEAALAALTVIEEEARNWSVTLSAHFAADAKTGSSPGLARGSE